MRNLLFIVTVIFGFNSVAQNSQLKVCLEKEFIYADSANGEQAICSYEPTGLLALSNGRTIITTILSVQFPNRFNHEYDEEISNNYDEKSHVSSGTVICLDNNQSKIWEIVFKDERVEFLEKFNDTSFVIAGGHISLEYAWLALVSQNGELIWKKKVNHKRQTWASSLAVHKNEIYFLHESDRMIFYHTEPNTVKKHRFFETAEKHQLYLMKLDSRGKKKWRKGIDIRKNVQVNGGQLLAAGDKVYLTYRHIGPEINPNNRTYKNSKKLVTLNSKGQILNIKSFNRRTLLSVENKVISCTSADDDSLSIYSNDSLIATLLIPEDIDRFWILGNFAISEELVLYGSCNNNLGLLLLSLDDQYQLNWYWNKQGDMKIQPGAYCVNGNDSIMIAAEKWSRTEDGYVEWIYLTQLKKQCTTKPKLH